jgi:Kef-type K+ transport system membrane component KefB
MGSLDFLVMFLLLVTLMAMLPPVFRRFKVPQVVAIMVVGIVIGPNGIDLLQHVGTILGSEYPVQGLYDIVEAFGLLGLVFLMALAGMEVNLGVLKSEKKAVSLLSFLTFILPAIAGYLIYDFFRPHDFIGKLLYASLFASHSVGIIFPTIRELNIVKTRFGVAILAATVITDLASLVMLAVAVQMKRHAIGGEINGSISLFDALDPTSIGLAFLPTFLFVILAYVAMVIWLIPPLSDKIFHRLTPKDDSSLTLFLMVVLLVVFVGELLGVNVIVGAFIAGVALVRSKIVNKEGHLLQKKLDGIGYGLLVPFLFLTIGMKTDMGVLFSAWENVAIVALTVVGLVGSKVFSGWLAMSLAGFGHKKGVCAGLMTVPQLSATLAAATVGLELQILDPTFFNVIVCLSIVTTLPVPTLVNIAIERWNIKFDKPQDKIPDTDEE